MSGNLDFDVIDRFYHISPKGFDQPLFELTATELLDADQAKDVLDRVGKLWKSCGYELPVSFVGMTMFNFCLTSLFFAAKDRVWVKFQLQDMKFQLEQHEDHAHIGYKLERLELVPLPEDQDERHTFLRAAWPVMISEMIRPFIESIAPAGGLKAEMIWAQFGAQLLSTLNYIRDYLHMPELVDRIEADLIILYELEPELFGRRRNPFIHKPRFVDNPWSPPDGTYILRSACCMYDRREGGEKCYNCPRMLPEERDERRKLVLAAAQH